MKEGYLQLKIGDIKLEIDSINKQIEGFKSEIFSLNEIKKEITSRLEEFKKIKKEIQEFDISKNLPDMAHNIQTGLEEGLKINISKHLNKIRQDIKKVIYGECYNKLTNHMNDRMDNIAYFIVKGNVEYQKRVIDKINEVHNIKIEHLPLFPEYIDNKEKFLKEIKSRR